MAGDNDAALPLLEEGYAEIDSDNALAADADCAMMLRGVLRSEGRIEESVAVCEVAMEISVNINDPAREAIAAIALGDTYLEIGNLSAALIAYQRSFDAATQFALLPSAIFSKAAAR